MSKNESCKIALGDFTALPILFGPLDENTRIVEKALQVRITSRNDEINITGENASVAKEVLESLMQAIENGETLDKQKVTYTIQTFHEGEGAQLKSLGQSYICVTARGKYIKPKTLGQNQYIKTIDKKDVVFGIGPAGTGKTFLAVAMAIKAFKNHSVSRIVITRPAVEAGESLGFLPGDLQMKVDPYLRPLYDALYDILGMETFNTFKEKGLIEIAPLAYMRGRTLDNAFIILDEAQNTTKEQMKMFLTRFGFGSKVVINGDITQIDLPKGRKSGLIHALDVLNDVEEIGVVRFSGRDVVRHELVRKIIERYDLYEKKDKGVSQNEKKEAQDL
ncbi:PhoH family protein [Fusibacter sp. JL298sf-3]